MITEADILIAHNALLFEAIDLRARVAWLENAIREGGAALKSARAALDTLPSNPISEGHTP